MDDSRVFNWFNFSLISDFKVFIASSKPSIFGSKESNDFSWAIWLANSVFNASICFVVFFSMDDSRVFSLFNLSLISDFKAFTCLSVFFSINDSILLSWFDISPFIPWSLLSILFFIESSNSDNASLILWFTRVSCSFSFWCKISSLFFDCEMNAADVISDFIDVKDNFISLTHDWFVSNLFFITFSRFCILLCNTGSWDTLVIISDCNSAIEPCTSFTILSNRSIDVWGCVTFWFGLWNNFTHSSNFTSFSETYSLTLLITSVAFCSFISIIIFWIDCFVFSLFISITLVSFW